MSSSSVSSRLSLLLRAIGPGILMAGAAIGVSHVVQSTRAGATYGLTLVWLVVAVNVLKYPFFEAGHRYTVATGESLLHGYRRLGKGFLWAFIVLNAFTAVISVAGVTFVTAVVAPKPGPLAELGPATISAGLMVVVAGLIAVGHYRWLSRLIKVMMFLLFVATLAAFFTAAAAPRAALAGFEAPSPWTLAALPFLIALMGWMPAPIEMSVWQSLWIRAAEKDRAARTSRVEAAVDFNVGYAMTTLLAALFVALGAWVMFGTGQEYASSSTAFTTEFVSLYTQRLGEWTGPIIAAAAFITMLSTTMTVIDAYPRSIAAAFEVAGHKLPGGDRTGHLLMIVAACAGGLGVIFFLAASFTQLIDLITTLAFLTAPLFAALNMRLVYSAHLPEPYRPGLAHRLLSWTGMLFLGGFSLVFLWVRFFA
ncbi:MAG: Nramp family divalent metal transporter [Opitutales bacterium]